MTGMQRKARERQRARQYTPDGLPRDPNAWTVQDWADLYRAVESVKRRVAARHQREEVEHDRR